MAPDDQLPLFGSPGEPARTGAPPAESGSGAGRAGTAPSDREAKQGREEPGRAQSEITIFTPTLEKRLFGPAQHSNWSGHAVISKFKRFAPEKPMMMKTLDEDGFTNLLTNGEVWFRRIEFFHAIEHEQRRDESEGRRVAFAPNRMTFVGPTVPHYSLSLHGLNITRECLASFTRSSGNRPREKALTVGIEDIERFLADIATFLRGRTSLLERERVDRVLVFFNQMTYRYSSVFSYRDHAGHRDMTDLSFVMLEVGGEPGLQFFVKTPDAAYVGQDEWRVVLVFLRKNRAMYLEALEQGREGEGLRLPVEVATENLFDFSELSQLFSHEHHV